MKSRNINLDIAKFVAIIFVISEHVLSEITITLSNDVKWNLGIFIWSFIKINVPVFLIVTAHLSFAGKINVDSFFLKKLKRIAIPLIFWSLFYYVFYSYSFEGLTISGAIQSILDGGSMYHLYFMYWFIGISFLYHLLSCYMKDLKSIYFILFNTSYCHIISPYNKLTPRSWY